MNRPTTTSQTKKRTTTSRIAAFALAGALSALTIGASMPGGVSFVAGKVLPDAGNAYETIAATEVAIRPGSIHVIAIRTQADAAAPRVRG
jgi:hypothetical protein